ncbi:MAG: TetR/AcrR family transcriptional regulator [Pseudomonadota bacterium]
MQELILNSQMQRSKSAKGRETQHHILQAALQIFIDHGYGDFSLQKVAASCGLSRGNVSYYYPTRSALLRDLLDAVVQGYIDEFEEASADDSLSAPEKLLFIIEAVMTDLGTVETSRFFPELWALANRNEDAREGMQLLYRKAREHIVEILKDINPALSDEERELVGLFISVSMEGHTPFVGPGTDAHKHLGDLTNIASFAFLTMAKSITSRDIAALKSQFSGMDRWGACYRERQA